MAGLKGTKELMKVEKPRYVSPFEEMERWFEEAWRRPFSFLAPRWHGVGTEEFETVLPPVDIYEEGKELVLRADLPGLEKKDVDINITTNILTISGERKKEEKTEKGGYYTYERTHGSFFRRFELPVGIDVDKIKAHMDNGVLEVRLPKTELLAGKKVAIS